MCLYILNDDYKSLPDPMYGYKMVRCHVKTNKLLPLYAFDDSIIGFYRAATPTQVDELPRKRWKTWQDNGRVLGFGKKQYGLATSYLDDYPLGFHSFVNLPGVAYYSKQVWNAYSFFEVLIVKVKVRGLIASGYTGALSNHLCVVSKEQKIEETLYPKGERTCA